MCKVSEADSRRRSMCFPYCVENTTSYMLSAVALNTYAPSAVEFRMLGVVASARCELNAFAYPSMLLKVWSRAFLLSFSFPDVCCRGRSKVRAQRRQDEFGLWYHFLTNLV